ncbi:MAG: apolipoprotein N-acyltransferase [Burkholderiales bacterium]
MALLFGAVCVCSFAPLNFHFVSWFALAGLFCLWFYATTRKRAAWLGFAFGLGLFGAGVSWIYIALNVYGGMPAPLAALSTFLYCALLASFYALVGWLQARWRFSATSRLLVVMPALIALSDWSRIWVLTGFPWLALGYSQVPTSPLSGYAPLLGVFGVTWLLATAAGAMTLMIHFRKQYRAVMFCFGLLVAIVFAGGLARQVQWSQPIGEPIKVSLLQGNVPQEMKFNQQRLITTLKTYLDLTEKSTARLIVMPETAIPLMQEQIPPDYLERLASHGKKNNGDVLVGLFGNKRSGNKLEYFSSVVSFGASPSQSYSKVHLVPFGEFIPFKSVIGWVYDNWLHIPLVDTSRGAPDQKPLNVAGQRVAVNICYEDVFGEEIIRQLPEATMLVNVTNDAWYGESWASQQHNQMSQMRAIETARSVLRATNTGFTSIIGANGNVVSSLPQFSVGSLDGEVQGMSGATPYVRFGNYPILIICTSLLLAAVYLGKRKAA